MREEQICLGHGKVPDHPPYNAIEERFVEISLLRRP
jgi:hypothetical protein